MLKKRKNQNKINKKIKKPVVLLNKILRKLSLSEIFRIFAA